jgi:hypothetical protein
MSHTGVYGIDAAEAARQRSGVARAYFYKCKLPKGKYSWKVYATDLAGNVQAKPGVRTLTVK